MARTLKSMTCAELIEYLQEFPAETPVVFAYNYGDHWRTTVTATIDEVESGHVVYSDYHSMWKDASEKASELDEDDMKEAFGEGNCHPAIIIRSR